MLKNLLLVVSCAVICLGASDAFAWGFFFPWLHDGGSCTQVPEPSGALLFAAGGLVFAAAKRRNRKS